MVFPMETIPMSTPGFGYAHARIMWLPSIDYLG